MHRFTRIVSVAAGLALLLVASGISWFALSAPPVEHLPLPPDLVGIDSTEGQKLLSSAESKTDYVQIAPYLVGQTRRAFCGPATSAAVINAALTPKPLATQDSLIDAAASAVKSELELSFSGLTLEELAAFLRIHGMQVDVVHAGASSLSAFRQVARAALRERGTFLIVNYDRRLLGQSGAGHISPVGAFDSTSDRVLVLDVATYKYPYTWIALPVLWAAMNTTDSSANSTRGYLLVTAAGTRALHP